MCTVNKIFTLNYLNSTVWCHGLTVMSTSKEEVCLSHMRRLGKVPKITFKLNIEYFPKSDRIPIMTFRMAGTVLSCT